MIEICPICGTAIMSAVECPQHGRAVHAKHCFSCRFFNTITFHCSYLSHPAERWEKEREKFLIERRKKRIAKLYERNS